MNKKVFRQGNCQIDGTAHKKLVNKHVYLFRRNATNRLMLFHFMNMWLHFFPPYFLELYWDFHFVEHHLCNNPLSKQILITDNKFLSFESLTQLICDQVNFLFHCNPNFHQAFIEQNVMYILVGLLWSLQKITWIFKPARELVMESSYKLVFFSILILLSGSNAWGNILIP